MLDGLYKPRAVAVIGASTKTLSIGYRVLENLRMHDFRGPIFPINPRERSVRSFRCYRSVLEVPDEIDLANICIPAKFVPKAVEECGEKGIKFVIIHSAGFREVGEKGQALENEVLETARRYGIRIYGPNSQGVMNSDPEVSLYANFTFTPMKPGNISILAQSGGVAELLNLNLERIGVGFRMYGSNGNASDISIDELLEYFGSDDETRVIMLYVESFQDPQRFVEVASAITPHKPILAIKSGTSEEGARAITSHTGALLDVDTSTDVIFEKAGVIRFHTQEDLVQAAVAFSRQPPPRGNTVTVVTNAGGPAIQATDQAMALDLGLTKLSGKTQQALRECLNPMSSVRNPVDTTATAGPDEFGPIMKILADDPDVHSLLLTLVTPFFVDNMGVAEQITGALEGCGKPVVATYMTNENWAHVIQKVRDAGIPVFDYPETAARVLAAMARYVAIRDRDPGEAETLEVDADAARKVLADAKPSGDGFLPAADVTRLLAAYSISLARSVRSTSGSGAAGAASDLRFPVVLKVDHEDVVHKTDEGGVVLDIPDAGALERAVAEMDTRFAGRSIAPAYVVQEFLTGGREVIMGLKDAAGAGTMIMIGTGGIYTEVLRDAQFRLAPLTRTDARSMIAALKGHSILAGTRGEPSVDMESLEDILLKLGQMAGDLPEIVEMDLNPVLAFAEPGRTAVVDARIRVRS
ncbi:MAG: acetate--CoA ligase family protein [Deltaproteobacteria bacterium]|nr:acetate--CoA ligase family protein [Deltaproteobacteria bacterium]